MKVKLKTFQEKNVIVKTVQGICGDLRTNLGHTQDKTKAFRTTKMTNENIPRTRT